MTEPVWRIAKILVLKLTRVLISCRKRQKVGLRVMVVGWCWRMLKESSCMVVCQVVGSSESIASYLLVSTFCTLSFSVIFLQTAWLVAKM